jgi:hypothetical protein
MAQTFSVNPGQISIPSEWEVHVQISLQEPKEPPPVEIPLPSAKPLLPPPRSNVVILRRPATGEELSALIEGLLRDIAKATPGFSHLGSGEFAFDDGTIVPMADIVLPVTPQLRAMQRHIFRIDDGVATQLIATTHEGANRKLDELCAILRTFRP